MMATAELSLALRNGTTIDYQIALTQGAAPMDCTGCTIRAHFRVKQKGAAKLALDSSGDATANGSSITWTEAAGGIARLRVTAADTALLPYTGELATDVEIEWPSGDVDRPLRITWTPDGEWTHG